MAQIVPDRTLPSPSRAIVGGNTYTIEGGTEAGRNLFHSFERFSVPTGAEAFFNNATTVENILTRVTGDGVSNIDGLLRTNGTANLFLLNPNGIVFGPNARLEVGGSFFASTAHRLNFRDGSVFSAAEPNAPPLLTVSVPVGVQFGNSPGSLDIRGTGNVDRFPTETPGLSVPPGQAIALVGGNITLDGAIVSAPSGRVEMGGVVEGNVSFDESWTLDYDGVSEWGDVQLLNRSSVFVPTSDLGNRSNTGIQVVGGDISMASSQLATLTQNGRASGNIDIQASELLSLGGAIDTFPFSASVETQTDETATGNGGHLAVTAPEIAINDGARLQTWSFGDGNAGGVTVNAEAIEVVGSSPSGGFFFNLALLLEQSTGSRISSENFGTGDGGNVRVVTDNLVLNDGGQIRTLTGASGKGGSITVNARNLRAVSTVPLTPIVSSGIASITTGTGSGGDSTISSQRATLLDGARLISSTWGSGRGGNLNVEISESFTARGSASVFTGASVGSGVFSGTFSSGNGGNVTVTAPQLTLSDEGLVVSTVLRQTLGEPLPGAGTGNGGDVRVVADSLELIGATSADSADTDSFTQVGSVTFGTGNAGDVWVSTRQLIVRDGSLLSSSVLLSFSALSEPLSGSGTGNSGRLQIDASESIEVLGSNLSSAATSSFVGTQTFGIGNARELVVNTDRLVLRDGGFIGTFTSATGSAGEIRINASDISIAGRAINGVSRVAAEAFEPNEVLQQAFFIPSIPNGETGRVAIETDRLTLREGGSISVQHDGIGNAGILDIEASQIAIEDDSRISATTAFGVGGNVSLNVRDSLQLRDDSQISLSALGDVGDGGNLAIEAATVTLLDRSWIRANAVGGDGGNIRIVTDGILAAPGTAITASSQLGIDGLVEISQPAVDTSTGLIQLPQNTIDLASQIQQGCASSQGNTFVITGRGGVPNNPRETLPARANLAWGDLRDWREIGQLPSGDVSREIEEIEEIETEAIAPIVEVTGWVRYDDGTVELVAEESVSAFGLNCRTD
ncbi:two-partner secretion domain-containing protein [Baaleninema simplex]|uniref:two-partner secretion domain-containing protein n=1 Tax=Baaleninema simplex TaxID=2862350 RepID=UPI00034A029E|nr:filamentous hemagglutinin N-terminal domain-containing protein [Baaleninema simplex]